MIVCLQAGAGFQPLPKDQQRVRLLGVSTPAYLVVYVAPRGDPASGHFAPADLDELAAAAKQDASARWTIAVQKSVVTAVQQDSGIRRTNKPDDPCPSA